MEVWSNLTTTESKKFGYWDMIGKVDGFSIPTLNGPFKIYVPLQFWFCKNPGLYLPLLAMQYHPVRINITFRDIQSLFFNNMAPSDYTCITDMQVNKVSMTDCVLWGDYVFLDVDERRRFVSNAHEYLIEQVQYTSLTPLPANSQQVSVSLEFNHPIREFIWLLQRNAIRNNHEWFNYSSLGIAEAGTRDDLLSSAVLQFDGFDRFQERSASYFRLVQPWQRHSAIPSDDYVYLYSIALRPEELQPSGSANASRIDSIKLLVTTNQATTPVRGDSTIVVYATNHNVLRVVDGFGGVLFTI